MTPAPDGICSPLLGVDQTAERPATRPASSVSVMEVDVSWHQAVGGCNWALQLCTASVMKSYATRPCILQVCTVERIFSADSNLKCNTCHRVRSVDAKHSSQTISTPPA
jgi:hypothetical protein